MIRFRVTKDHIKLLKRFNITWNCMEYGAPTVDPKRPYDSGDVPFDIARILGWPVPQEYIMRSGGEAENPRYEEQANRLCEKAEKIHRQMAIVLQLVVLFGGKALKPGLYRQKDQYDSSTWEYVK